MTDTEKTTETRVSQTYHIGHDNLSRKSGTKDTGSQEDRDGEEDQDED
jgi:hypothetical protein